jgi:hypothetical protein
LASTELNLKSLCPFPVAQKIISKIKEANHHQSNDSFHFPDAFIDQNNNKKYLKP